MEAAELGEVIADVIGLLLAAFGFNFVGWQWRQFRDWAASRAKQAAGRQKPQTRTHNVTTLKRANPALGEGLFKQKLYILI
jgi:hypothetical protein